MRMNSGPQSPSTQVTSPTPAGDIDLGDAPAAAVASLDDPPPELRGELVAPSPRRSHKLLAAAAFGGLTFAAAALGRPMTKKKVWYKSLRKSSTTPPSWVFGAVWSVLYPTIAYSGYRTWARPASPARTHALRLWGLQLALNASWTPLFFGAHLPKASAAVSGALVPAIAGYAIRARKVDKLASALMLPYLGWSIFAAFLNVEIVRKNGQKSPEGLRKRAATVLGKSLFRQ